MKESVLEKDLRIRKNIRLLNESFYFSIYTFNDHFVYSFDTIEECAIFLNIPVKKVLYSIRNNVCLIFVNHKIKIYMFKKEKEERFFKRI